MKTRSSLSENQPTNVGTRFIASGDSSLTPPSTIPMVQITDLKKNFTLKPILRGINLEIHQANASPCWEPTEPAKLPCYAFSPD